jgi:hypothetical protein
MVVRSQALTRYDRGRRWIRFGDGAAKPHGSTPADMTLVKTRVRLAIVCKSCSSFRFWWRVKVRR